MKYKDAYWFSHDSNAKDDPKCVQLIDQLGLEGYGIFWVLVEVLREQRGYKYPLKLLPALAKRYSSSTEKFATVVKGYDLFSVEGEEFFFSESLCRRMAKLDEKREQARQAGLISAEKRKELSGRSTTVQRPLNDRSTITVNKNKKNYKKGENIPPSMEEVKKFCFEEKLNVDYEGFFNHYESNGWTINGNPMKNWQARVKIWKDNNKVNLIKENFDGVKNPDYC